MRLTYTYLALPATSLGKQGGGVDIMKLGLKRFLIHPLFIIALSHPQLCRRQFGAALIFKIVECRYFTNRP